MLAPAGDPSAAQLDEHATQLLAQLLDAAVVDDHMCGEARLLRLRKLERLALAEADLVSPGKALLAQRIGRDDGDWIATVPRGFYLRTRFPAALLHDLAATPE